MKVDIIATLSALLIAALLLIFPFVNPCTSEDGTACTWTADTSGNERGQSFTDYYGITTFYH